MKFHLLFLKNPNILFGKKAAEAHMNSILEGASIPSMLFSSQVRVRVRVRLGLVWLVLGVRVMVGVRVRLVLRKIT